MKGLEIPIPPETFPLFHDAMCTAICMVVYAVGPDAVRGIDVVFDEKRGLEKAIIYGDAQKIKEALDALFGGPKLKPSEGLDITTWEYGVGRTHVYLRMGRLPEGARASNVLKSFYGLVNKQYYMHAKGWRFPHLRKTNKKLKPIAGHLDVSKPHPAIAQLLNAILIGRRDRQASVVGKIRGENYTLYLLLGGVPTDTETINEAVEQLYSINMSKGSYMISENIKSLLMPGGLELLLKAQDVIFYNLVSGLLRHYIQGDITKIGDWPPIRIYVFKGGKKAAEKDIVAYFSLSGHDWKGLYGAVRWAGRTMNARPSDVLGLVNDIVKFLGELAAEGRRDTDIARGVDVVLPRLRLFLNDLFTGIINREACYNLVRVLEGLKQISEKFVKIANAIILRLFLKRREVV